MYRAKTTFWAPDNRLVREGDVLPDGDDVIDGREELFDPVLVTQVDESRRRRGGRPRKQQPEPEPERVVPKADHTKAGETKAEEKP